MSRPNFTIVEGQHKDFSDIYEDFKQDYLSSEITVDEILEKYGISTCDYNHLKSDVAEETGVNRKPHRYNSATTVWLSFDKYIDYHKKTRRFRVSKFIHGKQKYFGVYDDLETARKVRDELDAHNWDDEYFIQLKKEWFGQLDYYSFIESIYEEFKKDFMNGESMRYLELKYGVSRQQYKNIARMIKIDENIPRKPQLHYKIARKNEKMLKEAMGV